MSSTSDTSAFSAIEAEVAELIDVAEAFQSAKYLALASLVWLVYDLFTTFDQEVVYFWNGRWSFSTLLYFLVGALAFVGMAMVVDDVTQSFYRIDICRSLYLYFRPSIFLLTASLPTCSKIFIGTVIAEIIGILFCEVVLVERVFYLWSHLRIVQIGVCLTALVSLSIALAYGAKSVASSYSIRLPAPLDQGCMAEGGSDRTLLPVFIPVVLLSTFLFIMTLLRIFRTLRGGENKSLANLLLRDGALFHFVVTVSIALALAASTDIYSLQFTIPVIISNVIYASHAVCASHLSLGLQRFAARMGDDANALLSNVELSRVKWRKGSYDNELVVEIDANYGDCDDELHLRSLDERRADRVQVLQTTRVGTFEPSPRQFGPGYEA